MKDNPTPFSTLSPDTTVIASMADRVANQANMSAIDRMVTIKKYAYIIAWGKWLGFTPETVQKSVTEAQADDAPLDAIQKINGKWLRVDDVINDTNRSQVMALAGDTSLHRR